MRISLVVPTRERAEYLAGCLDAALRVDDPDLEIVVSDNRSEDASSTVLAARADPRLRCVRTAERLSMRANFEHGLDAASGDYLMFIGDDDGVLPSGIAHLRRLLERHRPEAACWRLPVYRWPSNADEAARGFVRIRFSTPYRRPAREAPHATLARLCACASQRPWRFASHASIYHGCVSRELIERVRAAQGGVYFRGAIPDMYAGCANLRAMSGPLLWTGHPASFGGVSERSNGASQCSWHKVGQAGRDELDAFIEEAASDRDRTHLMDLDFPCEDALTLDMLDLALAGQPEHAWIDFDAWLSHIRRRVARMPREKRARAAAALEAYCRAKGFADARGAIDAELAFRGPETVPGAPPVSRRTRLVPWKIELADPIALATVAGAQRAIEEVLGRRRPLPGTRWARWFGALHRARRVVARWRAARSGKRPGGSDGA